MLNAVEKLYSILVRLGSLIINVLATLKCVGLQKIYARWRWSPRSLLPIQIQVKFHSTLGGLQRPRDTLDIALWRKKDACLSSKDAFLRKNILKNPSRERASFDSLLASFGVSLNAKRCALNRKLES